MCIGMKQKKMKKNKTHKKMYINKLIITSVFLILSHLNYANDNLILIKIDNPKQLYSLFDNKDLTINFYNDNYVIGILNESKKINFDFFVLEKNAFSNDLGYFLIQSPLKTRHSYFEEIKDKGIVLFEDDRILVVKPLNFGVLIPPARNHGIIYIPNNTAILPTSNFQFPIVLEPDTVIQRKLSYVDIESLMGKIQHLENYETRVYFRPESIEAQNWIAEKFASYGLTTDIQRVIVSGFPLGPSNSSGNVIATQRGNVFPDEYIVVGAHYDSWSWNPINVAVAPGADDNASGTAGVIEIARILSQYEFERSIIYIAFAAEEVGLIGSRMYASRARNEGKRILGYFNLDMIGYLFPGNDPSISLIYPSSATPLANYYVNIANIYFPNVPIFHFTGLVGGDSDHTSFNQNGFMGIYPFEDEYAYSPFIHSAFDLIGPSVNNPELAQMFTQIALASIATLAGIYEPEPNSNQEINLTSLNIFPNPTKGVVNLDTEQKNIQFIQVFNKAGKKVLENRFQNSIDLSSLPSGNYFLKISIDNQLVYQKVVKI